MGHGTLAGGVQRLVKNGFDMVDGVQRKQKKGLALVDGVQRDIGFTRMFTVTLTGTGWNATPCNIVIDGVKYAAAQTIEVPEGAEMVCTVFNMGSKGADAIRLNGVGVASAGASAGTYAYWTYTHMITGSLTVAGLEEGMVARIMEITTDEGGGE